MHAPSALPPCVRPTDPDSFPLPRHLVALAWWLHEQTYTPVAIDEAVAFAHRWGTVQCAPTIDPEDRDIAESLLPEDPAWDSPLWDAIRVGLPD